MPPRTGFTLLEVLVAIGLIGAGLLATVAASAAALRAADEGRSRAAATALAVNRLEWLRARPCAAQSGISVGPRDMRETWSLGLNDRVREMRDSVTFAAAGVSHAVVLQ